MKKSKLILIVLLVIGVLITGCGNKKEEKKENEVTGSITEILDKIVEKAKGYDTDKEYGIATMPNDHVEIDLESIEDDLGITKEEYEKDIQEYIESKPSESYLTHSIILIKVKDGVDTSELAKKITKGVSPYRFSSVKPDKIQGAYSGNYILVVSSSESTVEAVYKAFEDIMGSKVTKIDRTNDWEDSLLG